MVEGYRRASRGKLKLLGNHQKCWLWGRNAVQETLRAGRWPIIELYLSDALDDAVQQHWSLRATALGVPVRFESSEQLRQRCRSGEHQGFVAKMSEFPYAELDPLLSDEGKDRLFLICDGIQDPYNFGAMLRTADAVRCSGVLIATQHQVGVTSLVTRASAGAVNHVPICRVERLGEAIDALRDCGVQVIGASEKTETLAWSADLRQPTALIIGNEGRGIAPELRDRCSLLVRIPQSGVVSSLNAAVSAGILLYEITRQRALSRTP